ncbi:MAG: penicillin-binding protein 2 [Bellilinea sp.]|jgi:cell division protein FtsI/penicillin-binding protein 2
MSGGIGRMRLIAALFVVLSGVIVYQMVRIQNNEHSRQLVEYYEKHYNQQVRIITPERGNIYDRWGNLLAGNTEVYEVGIAPPQVTNPETVARDLSAALGVDYQDTLKIAQSFNKENNQQYELIDNFVSADKIRQLEEKVKEYAEAEKPKNGARPSLAGVYWKPHLIRSYPELELAANILGFYNFKDRQEGRGMLGLEEQYNNLLAGSRQRLIIPMNPSEIEEFPEIPPGASLVTTLDRNIQAAMERIIRDAVELNGAESGTLVVMDPKTGEVLAMATSAVFNPNEYWNFTEVFPEGSDFNRAISQVYESGSVFKVLTMAAALDSGTVDLNTTFTDVGVIEVGGAWIYNWDRGAWGPQDMTGCMQHSLNVCLAWIAQEMGPTLFYKYMQDFGIGRFTGIDLAGEQVYPLSLPGDSNWYPVNLATNSFGQGVATTPIQMITAIAAMANDGKMMAPHLVKAYIQDGIQYEVNPRVIRQVVKPETARMMTDMLAISLENEASNALVEGYRVAGKTGTAQIPGPTGYTNQTNASFVGWGPVNDPRFIVYVWLEKPTSSEWGSVVAAPVFSQAVQELVLLMKIPPDEVREQHAAGP